ncbi:MAG: efflux RND transporter periplasmic adaptor subunit [Pseudomonadota bacterium]
MRTPIISTVVVVEVLQGDVHPRLQLSGRLQPRLTATLSSEVVGRVVERVAEPGQQVAAGALLLRLEDDDYRDALARAEAQLSQERAAVARDRRLFALARQNRELQAKEVARLGTESLTSVSRHDEARQRLLQLEAEEARLNYAVVTAASRLSLRGAEQARAQRDLERCRIVAPFAGIVNEVLADVGDRIAINRQLASLVTLDELDFYAELPGNVQTDLILGQALAVSIGGVQRDGQLVSLQREPDHKTHTLALRIRVVGEGLMPGSLAETLIPLRPLNNALKVPVAALLREDGKAYLFVEKAGELSRRQVQTGVRDGDAIVVLSGLAAGERVVARDVAALSDAQQVKAVNE